MDRHVGSRPTVSAWMSLMSIILKFYTGSLMINLGFHDILGSGIKQDHRSGKERQCCRYIRTVSIIYIARVIFRVRLCPQPIKLNGLFLHALTIPDQVVSHARTARVTDIWDQEPLCAYRNDQIKTVYVAETAACPKRQAVFLWGNGDITDEKIFTRS